MGRKGDGGGEGRTSTIGGTIDGEEDDCPTVKTVRSKGVRPAVSDDGTGVRRVAGLHPTQEGQEGGGVLGNAVVRPRRELELANFPLLARAVLKERGRSE